MAETPQQPHKASPSAARDVPTGRPESNPNPADTKTAGDSVPMASGSLSRLPARLGRYQVEKLLGRGNMGAVYLARDTQLNRPVALKVPKLGGPGARKLLQRLRIEAQAAAQLDHPCICPVYDSGEIDGISFIALKYVEGDTLDESLKRKRRTPAEIVELVEQLAEGLAEAHDKQIYHRDLKPANIKLTPRGTPVIMDFGLAKIAATVVSDASKTQSGTILGSPAYMAPEQAAGRVEDIDQRSDLYALGVMFFEMLTGQWPFTGAALQVMGQKAILDPPSPLAIDRQIDPKLAAICHKLIARKSADRYQTAQELIADLRRVKRQGISTESAKSEAAERTLPQGDVKSSTVDQTQESVAYRLKSQRKPPGHKPRSDNAPPPTGGAWRSIPPVGWMGMAAVAVLLVGFGFWVSGGRTQVKTANGTLVIDVNEPDADVFVDGEIVIVRWGRNAEGRYTCEVEVSAGTHGVRLNKDGYTFSAEKSSVTVGSGRKEIFTASLVSVPTQPRKPDPIPIDGSGTRDGGPQTADVKSGATKFGGRWYKVFDDSLSWDAARRNCEKLGGRLAASRSYEDNVYLVNLAEARKLDAVWLGGTDEVQERKWVWADGSPIVWTNWDDGQPNNDGPGGEHYLLLLVSKSRGRWWDQPSTAQRTMLKKVGYVCEWDDETARPVVTVRPAFFNGQNLEGWEGLPGYWWVQDGAIVGAYANGVAKHTFLVSRQTYKDFQLRFKVRMKNPDGNSGLQFRSRVEDRSQMRVVGPQIEIAPVSHSFPPGSALNEPNAVPGQKSSLPQVQKVWQDNEFNEMTIRCEGRHVQVTMRGIRVLDWDYPDLPEEGVIAWQLHGKMSPGEVTFKDIEFADLTRGDKPLPPLPLTEDDLPKNPPPNPAVAAPGFEFLF
ncbi:MAG: DUF1080 domain-containing protein, partial [Planctomycetes bacterium]|nr:DUF1080 domain-containing protein [Planctomycetota bacterium]